MKTLSNFPKGVVPTAANKHRKGHHRYDWATLLDGRVHSLVAPDDFRTVNNFRTCLRKALRVRGVPCEEVLIGTRGEGEDAKLYIQRKKTTPCKKKKTKTAR